MSLIIGVDVPRDFGPVIEKKATADGITYHAAFLALAMAGAECFRNHIKTDHKRRKK